MKLTKIKEIFNEFDNSYNEDENLVNNLNDHESCVENLANDYY